MKSFVRFSFVSTLFTYLVIFTGGLVRVSGAGLGCPDWPKCFGRWLPPLSYDQVPVAFDATQVNLVLAWIEYLNRILGVILGILVAVTAILAIKNFRKTPSVLAPSVFAGLLVAFLGWQGGKVVETHLEPFLVSMHLIIALALACLLLYATLRAYYLSGEGNRAVGVYPQRAALWVALLWLLVVVQVVLGTEMPSGLEALAGRFPLADGVELIAELGAVKYIHPLLGVAIALVTIAVGLRLLAKSTPCGLAKQGLWLAMLLVLFQLLLGLGLIGVGTPPFLQVFHLWLAALLVGTLLLVFTVVRQSRRAA
jgi:cytochrome c oxidase assembly protein subunit 15